MVRLGEVCGRSGTLVASFIAGGRAREGCPVKLLPEAELLECRGVRHDHLLRVPPGDEMKLTVEHVRRAAQAIVDMVYASNARAMEAAALAGPQAAEDASCEVAEEFYDSLGFTEDVRLALHEAACRLSGFRLDPYPFRLGALMALAAVAEARLEEESPSNLSDEEIWRGILG